MRFGRSMIYIDAREGLSGDMVLAAMIGLLEEDDKIVFIERMQKAARVAQVDHQISQVNDLDETGLAISYSGKGTESAGVSYDEAHDLLNRIRDSAGAKSEADCDTEILDTIFEAEAAAHDLRKEEVHLHEVGRASSILNMFGTGQAHSLLKKVGAGDFVCSTITTGKGIIVIAHGAVRLPAPASKHLLEGLDHVTGTDPGERATPTGIAAVKVIARSQSDDIPKEFNKRSVGFGTRRFGGRLGRTVLIWP